MMDDANSLVACICEGGAESEIINILLDHDLLIFNRSNMLNEDIIPTRNARQFEQRYLRKSFQQKITVYRIIDSHREKFNLSKEYIHKISVVNVVTSPEIEMLLIIAEEKYDEYLKVSSKMLPSEFCKKHFKCGNNIKRRDFIANYFSDVNFLVDVIKKYKSIRKIKSGEIYLADLLK